MPKIAADDAFLFGSLGLLAIGCAMIVAASTGDAWLAIGVALAVFGLPAFVVTFLAAGATE